MLNSPDPSIADHRPTPSLTKSAACAHDGWCDLLQVSVLPVTDNASWHDGWSNKCSRGETSVGVTGQRHHWSVTRMLFGNRDRASVTVSNHHPIFVAQPRHRCSLVPAGTGEFPRWTSRRRNCWVAAEGSDGTAFSFSLPLMAMQWAWFRLASWSVKFLSVDSCASYFRNLSNWLGDGEQHDCHQKCLSAWVCWTRNVHNFWRTNFLLKRHKNQLALLFSSGELAHFLG